MLYHINVTTEMDISAGTVPTAVQISPAEWIQDEFFNEKKINEKKMFF